MRKIHIFSLILVISLALGLVNTRTVFAVTSGQGSVGVQGTISSPPPSVGATISLPRDGATFSNIPVTVSGICPPNVLVKVFKNNVFSGSAQCNNGSFSLLIDLFSGRNELVARVYDALDQAGPDSSVVAITFDQPSAGAGSRPTLTSVYAKKGANPGEVLTWPIVLAGGDGPYAVSVDWGDGKTPDLSSQQFTGTFNIQHTYDNPGLYNVIVKAGDKNGIVAFLQLVGVANGALSQETTASKKDNGSASTSTPKIKILWQPAAIVLPFMASTFWLGKRYELLALRRKIERGSRPFR